MKFEHAIEQFEKNNQFCREVAVEFLLTWHAAEGEEPLVGSLRNSKWFVIWKIHDLIPNYPQEILGFGILMSSPLPHLTESRKLSWKLFAATSPLLQALQMLKDCSQIVATDHRASLSGEKLDQILFLHENCLMANFDLGWL